jgi:hypothetical protein
MKYLKSWNLFEKRTYAKEVYDFYPNNAGGSLPVASSDGFSWDDLDRLADLGLNHEPTEHENRLYTFLVNYEYWEAKDLMRARNLAIRRGVRSEDGMPYAGEAEKMAKLITDVTKLVKRAKAVWRVYQGPGFDPFYRALRRYGFSEGQIQELKDRAIR